MSLATPFCYFFAPCNFPQGQTLRQPHFPTHTAYFKGEERKMTFGPIVFSGYHDRGSLSSFKSLLQHLKETQNFEPNKKMVFFEIHPCCCALFFQAKILSVLEYWMKSNMKGKMLLYFVFKKVNGFLM